MQSVKGAISKSSPLYLFSALERPFTCLAEKQYVASCGQPDRAGIELVVIMAQGVAEASVYVRWHIGGDACHDVVADADRGLGYPRKASLDRIEYHRVGNELIVGHAIDITPDPFGVFDDMLQP